MQFQGNKLVKEILHKVQTQKPTHYHVKKLILSKQFAPQILQQFSPLILEEFSVEIISQKEFDKLSKIQRNTHPMDHIMIQIQQTNPHLYYSIHALQKQNISLQYTLNCIDINDPGNMGSIIRTNLALLPSQLTPQQYGLFLTPQTVDVLQNEKCIQSSRGYILDYPIIVRDSFENICQFFSEQQQKWTHVVAHSHSQQQSQPSSASSIHSASFPLSIWISNEHHGLQSPQWNLLHKKVNPLHYFHIPLRHGVESLNVLSATSILLHNVFEK